MQKNEYKEGRNMKYKVVFLDIDNTLLDFDKAEIHAFRKTMEDAGIGYNDNIFKVYNEINDALWQALEVGKTDVATLKVKRFEQLVEVIKVDYLGSEISKLYERNLGEMAFEIEGAYEVCKALSKQCELAIITNGIAAVQKSRIEKTRFRSFIKRLFISEEIGISKPDAGIFEYALSEMNVMDKSKVLMVGDSLLSDIKGSQNAGIDSCFFNPNAIEWKKVDPSIKPTYEIKKLSELIELLS